MSAAPSPASILQLDGYAPQTLEAKWQAKWDQDKLYETDTADTSKPKFYALSMFPYPSGRLHMGHVRNYTLTDVIARFKRMQGHNVLHPMGWDSFGLPAENAAIERGVNPGDWTEDNIATMNGELRQLGLAYDWSREIASCRPDYYRWNQWIFLQLYKKGLAYKKDAAVNWDPVDQTVLANEQVIDGKSWRSGAQVERRYMSQWFFKITEYADKLLDNLPGLTGWPERVKNMQANWIDRSIGAEVTFQLKGYDASFDIFTTRPDTIYGVTFMCLAPEHPLVDSITTPEQKGQVELYKKLASQKSEIDRTSLTQEKTGVWTGAYAINPFNGEEVPVWISDYVLAEYGTGAVMAVPAHDGRDFAFAKKFGLNIKQVVADTGKPLEDANHWSESRPGPGVLVNSEQFDGLESIPSREVIIDLAAEKGFGKKKIQYRLRDWLVSRQRYWGTPIPIIYCDHCGVVPVPEDQLPVTLPSDVTFTGKGTSPLASHPDFTQTVCPKCGNIHARRETDTMDTFVCSSWYFLRYLDPHNDEKIFDAETINRWMPVDQYVGGIEHAILHLMYSRFFMMALSDAGACDVDEPFARLLTQGMVLKDGTKMSKSRGNIVSPVEIIKDYGADTARFFILSDSPPEADFDWKGSAVEGCYKFLHRLWALVVEHQAHVGQADVPAYDAMSPSARELYQLTNQSVQGITKDIEGDYQFNTVISKLRIFVNHLAKYRPADAVDPVLGYSLECLLKVLAPITPHLAEELWSRLKGSDVESVHLQAWPSVDERALVSDTVTVVVQVNGKLRDKFDVPQGTSKEALEAQAKVSEKVTPFLDGKTIRKVIVVPNKLVNIVAN